MSVSSIDAIAAAPSRSASTTRPPSDSSRPIRRVPIRARRPAARGRRPSLPAAPSQRRGLAVVDAVARPGQLEQPGVVAQRQHLAQLHERRLAVAGRPRAEHQHVRRALGHRRAERDRLDERAVGHALPCGTPAPARRSAEATRSRAPPARTSQPSAKPSSTRSDMVSSDVASARNSGPDRKAREGQRLAGHQLLEQQVEVDHRPALCRRPHWVDHPAGAPRPGSGVALSAACPTAVAQPFSAPAETP